MGVFRVKPFPVDLIKTLFTKYPSRNGQATTTVFIFQMFSLQNKKATQVIPLKSLCVRLLTVCARCSCSGREAGFGRCRVSTVLRPGGTVWGWEDMLAQPLPLQAGSGCCCRADATHYRPFLLACNLWEKKRKENRWDVLKVRSVELLSTTE